MAVQSAEGLANADHAPAFLAAVGEIDPELRRLPPRSPELFDQVGELPRGEQGLNAGLPLPDLLDDDAAEKFKLLELGIAGRGADMPENALADTFAVADGLDHLDLSASPEAKSALDCALFGRNRVNHRLIQSGSGRLCATLTE